MKECPACSACYPDDLHHCGADGKELRHSIRGDLVLDGRYKLESRLGDGGMGIVYKASHVFLKSTHAVKVILPDLVGNDPSLGTRFRQEAMVAASIVHRNIVRVTDFGMANREMPYLVMEFLSGKSLHVLLRQHGRLSTNLALEIMEAITAGVGAAHRQTVIHRDLKPLNILLQEDLPIKEGLKVLDFGLAKIKSEDLLGSFVQARTTSLMGSPHYMAPEQWSEGEPDTRADIYSLGVILYEMLAGETPFNASSMPEIMKKHLMDNPPTFASIGVQVPPPLEGAICRALEKDARDRPATAEAFMKELREAAAAQGGPTSYAKALPAVVGDEVTQTISERFDRGSISREDLSLIETQRKAESEADRLLRELEVAQSRAEEARERVEEAASRRAELEEARKRAQAEAARKLAAEEAARKKAQEEARLRIAGDEIRKRAEEEATRRLAADQIRKRAQEEAERQRLLEEANRLAGAVEAAQHSAEEARQRAEAEAERRVKEEAGRKAAEEKAERLAGELAEARSRAEEAQRRVEDAARKRAEQEEARNLAEAEAARKRTEQEARLRAKEEAARKAAEEKAELLARALEEARARADQAHEQVEATASKRAESEMALERAEAEARRLAEEKTQRQRAQEEIARKLAEAEAAQKLAEEEARKLAIEEANRLQAQEEANRLAREVEAAQRGVEEARGRAQQEAQHRAREEAGRKAAEEKAERLTREVEEARARVEEQAQKHAEEEVQRTRAEQEAKRKRAAAEAQRLAEDEAARELAEEEIDRFAREVEEAQRRAEEAGQRAEELARMRAEDEAARRRAEEEALRLAREVEDARHRIDEVRAKAAEEAMAASVQAHGAAFQPAALRDTLASQSKTSPEVLQLPTRRISPKVLSLGAVVLIAATIGGYAIFHSARTPPNPPPGVSPTPTPADVSGKPPNSDTTIKPDMVFITGGTFMMGRNDAPNTLLGDAQRPAHSVKVGAFLMERTEVTNAEYAQFVELSHHAAPKGWSFEGEPPEGQENLPVTNVSLDDAVSFATWRSTRDKINYRLPSEEEWEYAARGGDKNWLYPWGNEWCYECVNLAAGKPQAVNSYPQGKNRWGILNLIGNVREWTSTEASIYTGNPNKVPDKQLEQIVIRGGSYLDWTPANIKARGSKEFPATLRAWIPRKSTSPTLGFRLVCDPQ